MTRAPAPAAAADRPSPLTGSRVLLPAAALGVAALLRLWRLEQNGFDNEYYAAAVRSMAGSWHNFLYNAADPAGFVSVDKPPVALWVQVAAARLFGFGWPSVLLPQVLEGLASVWVVWHLVRRRFGETAGFLAALFLAVTPISVAVDRSGNTESCLALVLLLAAWALTRAAEDGRRSLLLLAMALLGLGFNVKMLAAMVVVPAFALVYWLGARAGWRRALGDLALGGAVLAALAVPWMAAYDLTPAPSRPFVGSSQHNSMVELAVGHNGVGRFVRLWSAPRAPVAAEADGSPRAASRGPAASAALPSWWLRLFVRAPVGPLRLADGQLAGQVGWLFPLAVAGAVAVAVGARWRRPVSPERLGIVLWAGWIAAYAAVYSWAGGIFHFYYMSTLGPPLAALAGIGVARLARLYQDGGRAALALPAALAITALWQLHLESSALGGARGVLAGALDAARGAGDWIGGLHLVGAGGAALAAGLLLALMARPARAAAGGALAVGVAALLAAPVAWSLSSVLVKGVAVMPSADLSRLGPARDAVEPASRFGPAGVRRLTEFLEANRHGERFLLATQSARLASPIIIETGEPVMATGGFHGLDRILTPDALARVVEDRQVRFAMLGDLTLVSRRMGGEVAGRPLADWIRTHGQPVDPEWWQQGGTRSLSRAGSLQLYDLRPETAPIVRARLPLP